MTICPRDQQVPNLAGAEGMAAPLQNAQFSPLGVRLKIDGTCIASIKTRARATKQIPISEPETLQLQSSGFT